MDFSLTKLDRIRKSKEYNLLKKSGDVFKTKNIVFNYALSNRMKLGVIVTKKVGNSVFRNRVKRWIREVFRTERHNFVSLLDIVIIPRQSCLSYELIKRDFLFFSKVLNEKSINKHN